MTDDLDVLFDEFCADAAAYVPVADAATDDLHLLLDAIFAAEAAEAVVAPATADVDAAAADAAAPDVPDVADAVAATSNVAATDEDTESIDKCVGQKRRRYGMGKKGKIMKKIAPFTSRESLLKHHDTLTRDWLVDARVCNVSNLRCVPFVTKGAGVERVTTSHFNMMKLLHLLNRTHTIDIEGLIRDLSRVDVLGCFFQENGVRCKAMSTHTSFYCGIHSVEEVSDERYHASVAHVASLLTARQ